MPFPAYKKFTKGFAGTAITAHFLGTDPAGHVLQIRYKCR